LQNSVNVDLFQELAQYKNKIESILNEQWKNEEIIYQLTRQQEFEDCLSKLKSGMLEFENVEQ
jgi:hypothetical protein